MGKMNRRDGDQDYSMERKAKERMHYADGGEAKWMQGAVKKPGALHRSLDVPMGEKIPEAKLERAEHSRNPLTRKRANLAETFNKYRPH